MLQPPSVFQRVAGKNDEFCIKNEIFCIKNEKLCIKTRNFAWKMMKFAEAGGDTSHVDARDLWFFDTFGYLLLKGVMDMEWLGSANDAMDEFATQPGRIRLAPR